MQRSQVCHNDVQPCNLGCTTGPQGRSYYVFDMDYACGWHAAENTSLPIHVLYSSYKMLLKGRPAPFSDLQSLIFTALDVSGCKLPWAEAAKHRGHFGALNMRWDLLEHPEAACLHHGQSFSGNLPFTFARLQSCRLTNKSRRFHKWGPGYRI